jgi:hypothetical protein
MNRLMEIARDYGLEVIEGDVLAKNYKMIDLARSMDFAIEQVEDAPELRKMVRRL